MFLVSSSLMEFWVYRLACLLAPGFGILCVWVCVVGQWLCFYACHRLVWPLFAGRAQVCVSVCVSRRRV